MGSLAKLWTNNKTAVILVLIACVSLPNDFTIAPAVQLDSSWMRAINMAIHNKLIFGKDFIFTYGPLGFFETRNSAYINKLFFILFDFFLVYGYYRIFTTFKNINNRTIVLLILCMFFMRFDEMIYSSSKLFIVYLFTLIKIYNDNFKNRTDIVYYALSAVLLLLIKINYGYIALLFLGALFIISLLRNYVNAIVLVIAFSVSLIAFLFVFRIDLVHYILYGLQFISAYNDAMFLPVENKRYIFLFFAIADILLLFLMLIISWAKRKKESNRLVYMAKSLLFVFFTFLVFKNGFVRSHFLSFFTVFPLFILFVAEDPDIKRKSWLSNIVSPAVVITLVVLAVYYKSDVISWAKSSHKPTEKFVKSCLPVFYFSDIFSKSPDPFINEKVYIPSNIVSEIKNGSVDIFPWDISVLQLNELNYKPRPIPQSYAAYTKVLDSLNAAFVSSGSQAEYLIFTTKSIDNRYPFWDEGLTKATVRLNYHYLCSFDLKKHDSIQNSRACGGITTDSLRDEDYLLLKADSLNKTGNEPVFEKIDEFGLNFGDTRKLNCPDSVPVYMIASPHYTLSGSILKVLFQPPVLNIVLSFDDGTEQTFRCIYSIMNTPLLINKRVLYNTELRNFFTGDIKKNKNIRAIKFIKGSNWQNEIKIGLYKMTNY